jgi:hypothetical protein
MRELVATVAGKLALPLSRQREASVVTIEKPNGLALVVTVPDSVLEWFVTANEFGKEIWSDWVDYYACEGETTQVLKESMATEVSTYIGALATSEFRLSPVSTSGRKSRNLEWYRHGTWQPVSVSVV